ncbi:hypothetical protein [Syntrophomonas wolfei]|jgi:hypothetical protein|nr:hypothetical protein [Syntrophomonas wolfei]
MSSLYSIAREMMDLSHTMLEALDHINRRMAAGHLESTFYLFQDILEAFTLVQSLLEQLPEEQGITLEKVSLNFQNCLDLMLLAYQSNDLEKAHVELQYDLLPNFIKWQYELEKGLKPYKDS